MLQPATLPSRARTPQTSALSYLVLVFGSTWLFQLPMLLAARSAAPGTAPQFMQFVVLGFFAPLLIALALSALAGTTELHALFKPLAIWRVDVAWYLFALSTPAILYCLAHAVLSPMLAEPGDWLYLPTKPEQIAALLLIPFTEQIPWRAYLYPRLRAQHGPLVASLATGLAWGLFHVQKHLFIDPQASGASALLSVVYMTAGSVVFTWFQLRTRGSLLLVVVAHMGLYLDNPAQALPALTPLAVHTVGFCVAAVSVVMADRETWRRSAPDIAAT